MEAGIHVQKTRTEIEEQGFSSSSTQKDFSLEFSDHQKINQFSFANKCFYFSSTIRDLVG